MGRKPIPLNVVRSMLRITGCRQPAIRVRTFIGSAPPPAPSIAAQCDRTPGRARRSHLVGGIPRLRDPRADFDVRAFVQDAAEWRSLPE
jgi:hypothetical protein